TTLLRSIHEVDRNATQIWFAFYPLSLFNALKHSAEPQKLVQQLLIQGKYELKDQIDSSHTFLYGHRYWPEVKLAVQQHAQNYSSTNTASLSDQILNLANQTAASAKIESSLIVGLTAIAFMTIQQTDLNAFSTPGKMLLDKRSARKSVEQILRERAKDDSQ